MKNSDRLKKLFTGLLLAFCLIIETGAQTLPEMSQDMMTRAKLPQGTLLHYRINQSADFYVYYAAEDRVETLYPAASLEKETALWHDIWMAQETWGRFSRHIRREMNPVQEERVPMEDSLFDYSEMLLQTQYVNTENQETLFSEIKDIPWNPITEHRDMGIWFIYFMAQWKDPSTPFTLCMNAQEHLILMTVEREKEEVPGAPWSRTFKMTGQGLLSGLLHRGSFVLSDEESPVVEQMELTLALSWRLPRLEWTLVDRSTLSYSDWETLIENYNEL